MFIMDAETQAAVQQLNNTLNQASGMAFNASESKKARAWQEQMWKKTYDQQLADQMRYNTPSAQVARLKAAGLNANLMYGSGVGSQPFSFGGSTGSPSSASAPNMYYADPLTMSQVRVNEAQAENIKADTAKKESETTGIDIQNDMNKIYLDNLPERVRTELDTMHQSLINLEKEGRLTEAKITETANNSYKLLKDADKSEAEAEYARAQTAYVGFYAKMKAAEIQLESVNTNLRAYGLELTAQGLKADLNIKDAEAALKAAQALKEKYEADNYWKTTGVPKYIGSVIALLASIIALKKVGKKSPYEQGRDAAEFEKGKRDNMRGPGTFGPYTVVP